jgi:P-type E1-E2 ATPase
VFDVEDFEELYATVEKNMVLVSVIGLEEKLRKNACETLQMITEAKLKPWILSGDRFNRVLPVAYKTRIIDKSYQNIVFDATEYEEIKVLIKT